MLAVPEVFAVGRRGGQQARIGRIGRGLAPGLHGPIRGLAHLRIGTLQPGPIAGDLPVLPEGPQRLAVGVELVALALEPPVRPLMAEEGLDGFGGRVR